MKKFKHVVPFFLAMIMTLAIPLAGCNSCGNKDDDDDKDKDVVTLTSVSVDASDAKTEYFVGEEFSSEGIVVTASFSNSTKVTCETNEYTVDSSAFRNDATGVYTITVSCTFDGVTKGDSYSVTVTAPPEFEGLEVTFVEGTQDTFALSATTTKVEIDTTKIIVKEINEDGTVGNAITDYTAKLFRGQEEITLTDGKAMVDAGAYAIWAEKASAVTGFVRSGFVLVYVNDTMVNFEYKDGTLTQAAGVDVISDTWTFTATYVTGATKEISSKDCVFAADTFALGNASTVVTYTDFDAKGNSVTKTTTVNYTTIKPAAGTVINYKYSFGALVDVEDGVNLIQSNLKGVNAFLRLYDTTASGADKNYVTYKEEAGTLEVRGVAFYVTFFGTGTITIGFASTGGSNESSVGLMDSNNKYIATSTSGVTEHSTANTYLVKSTATTELKFTITKPGTYAICSRIDGTPNRNARINSIEMVDNV